MEESQPGEVRFDELTRKQISEEFKRQIAKHGTYISFFGIDEDAECFITVLERFAEGIPEFKRADPPKHQVRREQLSSIARHLDELAQKLMDLDSAALGYMLHCALTQLKKEGVDAGPDLSPVELMAEALEKRAEIAPALRALGLGAQIASQTLPAYTYDFFLQTTLGIERLFYEYQLKFSVTETGFSAQCLRAVFEAGGLDTGSIKYWLGLARRHEDSMTSTITEIAQRASGES